MMKFSIAINMLRNDASVDVREVWRHSLDLLRIAEQGAW